jgi:hypothetical protein
MSDDVDPAYADAPVAIGCEEGFLLLGERPLMRGRSSDVWLAAAPDAANGGMQLAIARRATSLALEMGEPYADFVRGVQVRATFAPPAPRLLASLGKDGKVMQVVEEHAGDVSFDDVVDATSRDGGVMSIGLALHMGARIAALFAAAEQHGDVQIQLGPRDVRVSWDGVLRVLPKAFPRWDERDGGAMVGTIDPHIVWAPPERVLGYRSTRRSEQYMLGVLLFSALAGRHPLHGDGMSIPQRLMRTVHDDVPPLSTVRPDVPAEVSALVDRCTQRSADARFATWAELTHALAEAHDRVEPVDEVAFAGLLAQLFPRRRDAALAYAEQVRMLDPSSADERTNWGYVKLTVPALPRTSMSTDGGAAESEWDDAGTQPDIDVAAWGVDARPMVRVNGTLLVDARAVTNAEYARFITATERAAPQHWGGARTPPLALFDVPVTWVSHEDAQAYARWARKRLPTAEEWRRAADPEADAHTVRRVTSGAVWEWTSTQHKNIGFLVCGGRWRDRPEVAAQPENISFENAAAADLGFRCVVDEPTDQ